MKYFIIVLLFLASCLPSAVVPEAAPVTYGVQRFVPYCEQGYWNGAEISYRPLENIAANSCQTYTLVNFRAAESKTSRISGLNLEINHECVTIDSIVTDVNIYERIRCSFDVNSRVLNIYLLGDEIRVITEIVVDGKPIYFPAIGVEDDQSETASSLHIPEG